MSLSTISMLNSIDVGSVQGSPLRCAPTTSGLAPQTYRGVGSVRGYTARSEVYVRVRRSLWVTGPPALVRSGYNRLPYSPTPPHRSSSGWREGRRTAPHTTLPERFDGAASGASSRHGQQEIILISGSLIYFFPAVLFHSRVSFTACLVTTDVGYGNELCVNYNSNCNCNYNYNNSKPTLRSTEGNYRLLSRRGSGREASLQPMITGEREF